MPQPQPEGGSGGDRLLDGSIGRPLPYPSMTNDPHAGIPRSLHQSLPRHHPSPAPNAALNSIAPRTFLWHEKKGRATLFENGCFGRAGSRWQSDSIPGCSHWQAFKHYLDVPGAFTPCSQRSGRHRTPQSTNHSTHLQHHTIQHHRSQSQPIPGRQAEGKPF